MSEQGMTSDSERAAENHHVVIEYHNDPEDGTIVATGAKNDCELVCASRTTTFDIDHVVKPGAFAEEHELKAVNGHSRDPEYASWLAEPLKQ